MPQRKAESVTDNPSSDIQVHAQPLTLDQLQLKFDFRDTSQQPQGCLGIQLSASHKQHLLASLIVMQQPSEIATLCCVQQSPHVAEPSSQPPQTAAIHLLFNAAKQFAIDRRLLMIQHLVPIGNCSEAEPDIRSALQQSGFQCTTHIDKLSLATSTRLFCEDPDAMQTLLLSGFRTRADVLQQPWTSPLLRLLQAILNSSQDLKAVPRPSAEDLLLSWAAMQARVTILIAKQPGDFSGLIVFSRNPTDVADCTLTLEYVGTDPALRRQQVASTLLRAAAEACLRDHDSVFATLTAYVDRHNTAACNLYARCGLTSVSTHELWTFDVGATSKSLNAPRSSFSVTQESDRA